MKLPAERGPLSGAVVGALSGAATIDAHALVAQVRPSSDVVDVVSDEDFQLALWVMYELHYLGFDGVDEEWEWDPQLLRVRRELETLFEAELRRRTDEHVAAALAANGDVATRLFDLTEAIEGPSVARFMQRDATREQFQEFLVHRSLYHLKESDPSSWVVPRITGKPKTALVELLYDEYGAGRADRLHATMFADGIEACGLDREYCTYIDQIPAYTLAVNNAMSLFGLHRRLRAAGMGHLGAFEATSSLPCRRFVSGIRRLGLPEKVAAYFDEHIEADAVHEQLALRGICAELIRQDSSLEPDVFFGAAVCLDLDVAAGLHMLSAWHSGRTSLRSTDLDPEAVA